MDFGPRRWPGILVGVSLLSMFLAVDRSILLHVARRPPDLMSFLLGLVGLLTLVPVGVLTYGLYGLATLTYDMNRDRVLIRWAGIEHIVPLDHIARVARGRRLPRSVRWWGIRWPGYTVGRAQTDQWGALVSYATTPLSHQLVLLTPLGAYGVSPARPREFLAGLELRRQMGSLRTLREEVHLSRFAAWNVWSDRRLWGLLLAGALANVLLFGYLCWRYATLPSFLPIHFDPWGQVDRIGDRSELFRLPLIGLLALAVDAAVAMILPPRLRPAGHLLLGGAILMQLLLGAGLWALMR